MATVEPLHALRYDPAVVGSLADVVAPPYDVIDDDQRRQLAARSPYNVVTVDLPRAAPGEDPYNVAGETFRRWEADGVLVREDEPTVWAHTQQYTGPDGVTRTRRGFFCRVRLEEYGPGRVRPHERTHPGPKEDRLRLMRATRADLSPIFSLYSDPDERAWQALSRHTSQTPWTEARDADGTLHRLWRVADADAIAAVQAATADAELLIADGHHRYETALTYAREIDAGAQPGGNAQQGGGAKPDSGGDDHRYVLMCLVALEDPGLTVFPTHRLVGGLDEARRAALRETLERDFEAEEVPIDQLAPDSPAPSPDGFEVGFLDARERRPLRLRLKDQAIADQALEGRSEAYRHLDTGVLEAIVLKAALGLSDDDISHLNGLRYARDTGEAVALLDAGAYDAAFVMRPTPVAQVRDIAAAGENMPPKSTYFFPKLLTGLLFNPL